MLNRSENPLDEFRDPLSRRRPASKPPREPIRVFSKGDGDRDDSHRLGTAPGSTHSIELDGFFVSRFEISLSEEEIRV